MRLAALALATGLLSLAAAAEESKLSLEASAGMRGKNNAFVVSGSGGLADGTALSIKLSYVRRYELPPGMVEEGQPDYIEELATLDTANATMQDGKFDVAMGFSERPPWSGKYRVEVAGPGVEQAFDFEVGKIEDLPQQRALSDREVYEEMARIQALWEEADARWKALGETADAGWADWRKTATERIGRIQARNAKRLSCNIYEMECQGKQRINWLVEKLIPLLNAAGVQAGLPSSLRSDAADVTGRFQEFREDFDRYLDFLGFGKIVDVTKVGAALAKMQKAEADIAAWVPKLPAAKAGWEEAWPDLAATVMETTMNLSGELPEAYFKRAERVAQSLERVFAHAQSVAAGRPPARPLDELRKEFRDAVDTLDTSLPRLTDDK